MFLCYTCRRQHDLSIDGRIVAGTCERCRCRGMVILDDSNPSDEQ